MLEEVLHYHWPGNVREIRNFVERMVVMTPYNTTEIASIPSGMLAGEAPEFEVHKPTKRSSGKLTKEDILAALDICHNHRAKTAEYLGISRRQLQYKIREYHISSRCTYEEEDS